MIKAFKTQPTIVLASEESIKKKVSFFLDVLKLDLSSVVQQPMALSVSWEKCVKPRCAVLSILMMRGKIKRKIKLISALITNSRVFSERFVLKYADDVPEVVKAFEGKIKFEGFGDQELEFLQLN
jgi:mTERF domain-containing protein, mitochondrial